MKAMEIRREFERNTRKWRVPMTEEAYEALISRGGDDGKIIFGGGCSIFSPLLFGKFFDPSDAFPLWDFEPESLLAGFSRRSGEFAGVDWSESDAEYLLRAELPGGGNRNDLELIVEGGKLLEISGQWRKSERDNDNWRSKKWWEVGYVRRIELPEDSNAEKLEAFCEEDMLYVKIPKLSNGEVS